MRHSEVSRETAETAVKLSLELDGSGRAEVHTGVGFLDHMLTLFACHGGFDLAVSCKGDLEVDAHHSVEDVGLCANNSPGPGQKRGINRYGHIILPMDGLVSAQWTSRAGPACATRRNCPRRRWATSHRAGAGVFRPGRRRAHEPASAAGRRDAPHRGGVFKALGRALRGP
ncbi:MAG: imidazoleglycerol-phosphate dehydratase [Oscillospiraceae bacterium]